MAESFSVRAILSAQDKGFSSTLKNALGSTESLADKIKGGFTFGILAGVGQQAFSTLTNGASELIGEINSSSKAWQTFEGNMKQFGKNEKEIKKVQKSLQSYAETTVYGSSDMASTYAQLEAVGVGGMKKLAKGTEGLVKGFGGLSAAAENPAQAMKSLSQQATQMAAKPKVAWEDFKIMLEQSPAGMAAVAKSMGISTEKLISKIQAGEVKTEDFFAAVEKAGTSEGFQKMATEAKTMDMALDGAKEALGNKLLPTFELVSKIGIKAIDSISEKIGKLDGDAIARKVSAGIEAAKPYWEAFKSVLADAGEVIKKVGGFLAENKETIARYLPLVLKLVAGFKAFSIVKSVIPGMSQFTGFLTSMAGKGISGLAAKLFGISAGEKAVGTASTTSASQTMAAAKSFMMMAAAVLLVSAGIALLAQSAIGLAQAGPLAIGVMAGLLVAVVGLGIGMAALLKSLAPMGAQLMPVATAMLALGGAVVLVAAGFAILTASAIALANAGTPAIACMVGMVAAVALLAVGAAALGPALTAGAVGFIAFGAAIVLVATGALIAAAAMVVLSTALPTLCTYGLQGATAITALGGAMVVFAAGAALAGAAAIVLGAGLAVAAVGIAAAGVACVVAAAGITLMAAGCTLLAASVLLTAGAVTMLGGALPLAATGATSVAGAFAALLATSTLLAAVLLLINAPLVLIGASSLVAGAGMLVFGAGLIVAGAGAVVLAASLKAVNSSMKTISKNAKTTQKSLSSMEKSVDLVGAGLDAVGNKAKSAMSKLTSAFDKTESKAKTAGKNVGKGFSEGVQSGLTKAATYTQTSTAKLVTMLTATATKATAAGKATGQGYATGTKAGFKSAVSAASSATSSMTTRLRAGRSGAYSAGAYISQGFAQGMRSQLSAIRSAANEMVKAANKAIQAKAKIHSPSKVTDKFGGFYGEGWVGGILGMVGDAKRAAEKLFYVPNLETPELALAGAYGGELSSDYEYYRNANYNITVVSEMDGREVAKATVVYTEDELNKRQNRADRKKGKV